MIDRRNGVGRITLNRPEVINAINGSIRRRLPQVMDELERDGSVGVILIAGAGERGFSVGADIKEMKRPDAVIDPARTEVKSWIESIDQTTKPVIAAIHGFCLGGGFELALACDIRIAAPTAVLGLPEVNLGLIPGGGGTQRLTRIVGLGQALDMLLSGDRIGAAEAHRIGLLTRLARDAATLQDEALALAAHIASKPSLALAAVKRAARTGVELELASGMRLERELFSQLTSTEDHKEAAAAFREKRSPVFNGR